MSEDLERKLESWADQASPVTADEARARAEAGNLVALGPDGTGAGGPPGSRRLMAAAAAIVLVGAVAIGGWVIANDGDDDPTGVDTVDQPTTTNATDPSTTVAPSTTLDSGDSVATTTPPLGTAQDAPKWIVVHSADHKLEVLERDSSRFSRGTPRVLAEFDDPAAEVADGEPAMMGRYLGPIVVSPDGQTVFYETCCEPAAGEVFRIPITGGEPEFVTYGTNPAISPDGTKLAVISTAPTALPDDTVIDRPALKVVDLTDGSEQRYALAEDVAMLANPAWSPDGTQLALERYDDSLDEGRVDLVRFDGAEDVLNAASTVARTDADGTPMHPVFDADGNILLIRQRPGPDGPHDPDPSQPVRAETYEPYSDGPPIDTRELEQPVLSQRMTGRGQFLIRTSTGGLLTYFASPASSFMSSGSGYLDAAW